MYIKFASCVQGVTGMLTATNFEVMVKKVTFLPFLNSSGYHWKKGLAINILKLIKLNAKCF